MFYYQLTGLYFDFLAILHILFFYVNVFVLSNFQLQNFKSLRLSPLVTYMNFSDLCGYFLTVRSVIPRVLGCSALTDGNYYLPTKLIHFVAFCSISEILVGRTINCSIVLIYILIIIIIIIYKLPSIMSNFKSVISLLTLLKSN